MDEFTKMDFFTKHAKMLIEINVQYALVVQLFLIPISLRVPIHKYIWLEECLKRYFIMTKTYLFVGHDVFSLGSNIRGLLRWTNHGSTY